MYNSMRPIKVRPYLSCVPMTCEEDIEVASVRDEDNEEPDEEKAGVLSLGAIDEQEGAGQREEDAKENLVMKKDCESRVSFQLKKD